LREDTFRTSDKEEGVITIYKGERPMQRRNDEDQEKDRSVARDCMEQAGEMLHRNEDDVMT